MTVPTSGIAAALMLSTASLCAAETRTIDRTLPLSASGTVVLDAHNGTIEVRTWDRPDVEIHIRIDSRGDSPAARGRLREAMVDIDGSPNLVSIRSREFESWGFWSWLTMWDSDVSPDVHYAISAPRTARWRIRDHNAKADIRDVNAAIEFETHNGSVWIANLNGPLELSMHNGDAHVDFASFAQSSRIASHNGSAELTLPASSKFEINSMGHHMRVDSDFPLVTHASDFGRHRVAGQVNGGGPDLRITSHNGVFRIRSK